MEVKTEFKEQLKVLDGNRAAAYGVMLCQPDVVCAYPITPQTQLLETLYEFRSRGLLRAEMLEPESEHSSMSVLRGASAAGARTFTATAAQGLMFMYEACINVATMRLPVVMVIVCRELTAPHGVTCGEQDAISARDAGWIQIHTESCQEILDSIIMAYRLAESPDILVPVTICYDGFFLSHLWEQVYIPSIEAVQRFLPPLQMAPVVDPQSPMIPTPSLPPGLGTEYRYKHSAALERAKTKYEIIDKEFQENFNRSYGGTIEQYKCEDAEIVLVTMGSCTGTARTVIDQKRDEGVKVGLIKVRMYRPFPKERLLDALKDKKAIGVIDRNVCFGWNQGALSVDLRATAYELGTFVPIVNFIGGLCGADITKNHIAKAIDKTNLVAKGDTSPKVMWLDLE
jgi:phenylglyoxylate dehydrogenase alpha subunit